MGDGIPDGWEAQYGLDPLNYSDAILDSDSDGWDKDGDGFITEDVTISKLLSCFIAYFRQFKSKSHIQGHFWKEEIKSFHLTPRLMGLQALLMEILVLKKGARFVGATCICL